MHILRLQLTKAACKLRNLKQADDWVPETWVYELPKGKFYGKLNRSLLQFCQKLKPTFLLISGTLNHSLRKVVIYATPNLFHIMAKSHYKTRQTCFFSLPLVIWSFTCKMTLVVLLLYVQLSNLHFRLPRDDISYLVVHINYFYPLQSNK